MMAFVTFSSVCLIALLTLDSGIGSSSAGWSEHQIQRRSVYHNPKSGVENNIRWFTAWSNGVCMLNCYNIIIENDHFVLRNLKKYSISTDDQRNINKYLVKYRRDVSYPRRSPPQNGDFYRFSVTKQNGMTILEIKYSHYVNGAQQTYKSKQYQLTGNWDYTNFMSSFSQFNAYIKKKPKFGVENNIRWTTTWTNGVCRLYCSYIVIDHDHFVLKNMKKYYIISDDQRIINKYLATYRRDVSYPRRSPSQNGDFYRFSVTKRNGGTTLEMKYSYYVNGAQQANRSKQYQLTGNWDYAKFNSFFKQFKAYIENFSSSVATLSLSSSLFSNKWSQPGTEVN